MRKCRHHKPSTEYLSPTYRAFENYKYLPPPVMDNIFTPQVNNFILRNFQKFAPERKKIVKYDLETVSYLFTKLWTFVPDIIKAYIHL